MKSVKEGRARGNSAHPSKRRERSNGSKPERKSCRAHDQGRKGYPCASLRVYHPHVKPLLMRLVAVSCAIAATGCPSEERRTFVLVRVVPEVDPSCGAPTDAGFTTITALGDFPEGNTISYINNAIQPKISIDTFPAETRALEVVVRANGGAELTVGRTREFDLSELEDGSEIPVFMAKPRGFCPTGSMGDFRAQPLVARAGGGVLVAGGLDSNDELVPTAEWYDPDRGQFLPLGDRPYATVTEGGLLGASMTTLADGRVAIVGGNAQAYQIYEPTTGTFDTPGYLGSPRAFHAAAALPDDSVALIGGCTEVIADSGQCNFESATRSVQVLDLESGQLTDSPRLGIARVGGSAYVEPSGTVLVFGGLDGDGNAVSAVERIDPMGGSPTETITDAEGSLAPLLSGGVLVGFAPNADPASAWVVPPESAVGSPVGDGPGPLDGATLTPLEDGKVLVFGGSAEPGGSDTEVLPGSLYGPFPEGFLPLDPVPVASGLLPQRTGHASVRLDDGSVLLLGGRRGDLALKDAWIYRHNLTGPLTPAVEISLGDNARQAELLSPSDPARGGLVYPPDSQPTYRLEGSGTDETAVSEWVIAAGPRFINPRITTRLGASAGGVAILLGYMSPNRYYYVELRESEPVRLLRVEPDAGGPEVICTGDPLGDSDLEVAADEAPMFQAQAGPDSFGVWREGVQLLDCDPDDPIERGFVGVGVVGGEGAAIAIDEIAAYR